MSESFGMPGRVKLDLTGGFRIDLEIEGRFTLSLRTATHADIPTLERWDRDPTVIASASDNPDATTAWGEENDWAEYIDLHETDVWEYWIAEVDGNIIMTKIFQI